MVGRMPINIIYTKPTSLLWHDGSRDELVDKHIDNGTRRIILSDALCTKRCKLRSGCHDVTLSFSISYKYRTTGGTELTIVFHSIFSYGTRPALSLINVDFIKPQWLGRLERQGAPGNQIANKKYRCLLE